VGFTKFCKKTSPCTFASAAIFCLCLHLFVVFVVAQEAGTFSDLQQSVGKHQSLLHGIAFHNRKLAHAVDDEAAGAVLAGGAGAEMVLARSETALADGDFEGLWLGEIKSAIAASHREYERAVAASGGRDPNLGLAAWGSSGKAVCLDGAGVESALAEHLSLVKVR
jgi:hypothetical protein